MNSGDKDAFSPSGIERVLSHGRFISCMEEESEWILYIYKIFLPTVSQGTLIQNNKICHEGIFWGNLPWAPVEDLGCSSNFLLLAAFPLSP